jgi:hypothetical protein
LCASWPGFVPAIHVFLNRISRKDVDARHKAGHGEFRAERDRFDGSFASAQERAMAQDLLA